MEVIVRKPTVEEKNVAEMWPEWNKEESTFPWEYSEQEACLILEGKEVVKYEGEEVEFEAGDYVIFPEGLSCTWEIK